MNPSMDERMFDKIPELILSFKNQIAEFTENNNEGHQFLLNSMTDISSCIYILENNTVNNGYHIAALCTSKVYDI